MKINNSAVTELLRDFLGSIEAIAKEAHGREQACHELICDLEDNIDWQPFSKLRTQVLDYVREVFVREETAYTEKHFDEAKDWFLEHRHEKQARENLENAVISCFGRDAQDADIDFDAKEFTVRITRRDDTGITRSRYLSDAEIVEVWEAETSRK